LPDAAAVGAPLPPSGTSCAGCQRRSAVAVAQAARTGWRSWALQPNPADSRGDVAPRISEDPAGL